MHETTVRSNNRLIIVGLVALVALVLAAGGLASRALATHPGTTVLVGDATPGDDGVAPYTCGDAANPCDTIQHGIDHASSGDTVSVAAGAYAEQLTIDKSLTLTGDTSGSCPGPGRSSPILDGGGAVGSAITISGGVSNVTIEGFEIANYRNRALGSAWTTGGIGSAILAWNATAIDNVTVRSNYMHDLGWSAVLAGNEGQALHDNWVVECNDIADVAAYAIELTNTSNSSVIDNQVAGGENILGETDDSQDGILIQTQVHTGAGLTNSTITVDGNTVSGPLTRAGVELLAWDSTDSLTAGLSDITVSNNSVSGSAIGAYIFSVLSNASISADVTGNVFDGNADGIQMRELAGGTLAAIDVTDNDIINSTGASSGVRIRSGTSAAGITVNYNRIEGNALLGINHEGTGTLDAEKNWWGDATGADHASNPHGSGQGGDVASDNVDFTPWYATSTTTSSTENVSVTHNPVIALSDSIQGGIDAALVGDTLSVVVGTLTTGTQVVIDKDLTLTGVSAAATTIKPGYDTGASGDARGWFLVNSGVTFDLSDVTLDGTGNLVWQAIRHQGQGTATDVAFKEIKYNESGPHYSGVAIAAFGTGPVDVTGSKFEEIGRIGVLYFGTGISGSVFSGNTYAGKGDGDFLDYGVEVGAGAVVDITNNTFSDNRGVASVDGSTSAGVLVTTYFGGGSTATISENFIADSTTGVAVGYDGSDTSAATVFNNSLTGNDTAVSSTALSVDASGNWWGSADAATVKAQADGGTLVDYSPWLAGGTDTDGGTPGFQGDFSVLHVDDDSPQSDATGHIQEGIDLVSGSTVNVEAGTYDEALDIEGHSGLTIDGLDSSLVTLAPTSTLCWNVSTYGCSRQTAVRVVDSTDIVVENVTMDFDAVKANFMFGVLYWDSTGQLVSNVLKNLSIDDLSGGYYEFGAYLRAPGYTDASRADIGVSNNTFVDTGRVGINIHDYVNADVSKNTFYKTTDDFGYAIELGSTSTGTISGNTIYGYDTPAASDGSTSAGIYVENAFTGGFFPLVTGVTKDALISDNEVYDSQWALVVGNEFDSFAGDVDIDVTLQNNDFHDNTDGGVVISDEDKENGSSVTVTGGSNTLANNGDYGYYIYTQGDGDIIVNLGGETITGHDTGVYLEDTHGGPDNSSYAATINLGTITGNTTYGMNNTVGTLSVNAERNWWGACDGPSGEGPGSGDAVSTSVDYDPWEAGKCDKDNDLLTDDAEISIYFTDPNNPDTDGDGCIDGREVLPKNLATSGGGRDPLDPWDFYDVNSDGVVELFADALATIGHFAPLGTETEYDVTYDRGPSAGPNYWNLTGPDGKIELFVDILGVIGQVFHDCR